MSLTGYLCSGHNSGVESPPPRGVGMINNLAYMMSKEHSAPVDSGSNSCQLWELELNVSEHQCFTCMIAFILDPHHEVVL